MPFWEMKEETFFAIKIFFFDLQKKIVIITAFPVENEFLMVKILRTACANEDNQTRILICIYCFFRADN